MVAGEPVNAGSTLDLPADTATLLIGIGKATKAEVAQPPEAEPTPPTTPQPEPEAAPAKPVRTVRKPAS
jgi:hypothetical protein